MKLFNFIVGTTLNLLDKLLLFVKCYNDMCPEYDYSLKICLPLTDSKIILNIT